MRWSRRNLSGERARLCGSCASGFLKPSPSPGLNQWEQATRKGGGVGTALRLALPSLPEEGQACCMILKGSLGEKAESHVAEAGLRLLR